MLRRKAYLPSRLTADNKLFHTHIQPYLAVGTLVCIKMNKSMSFYSVPNEMASCKQNVIVALIAQCGDK